MLREEEKEVLADLRELEADQAYCASDSDESWGNNESEVVYEWKASSMINYTECLTCTLKNCAK